MADDEGGTPAEPQRIASATPNRGKPREAPLIEETALPGEETRRGPEEAWTPEPIDAPGGVAFGASPGPESSAGAEAGPAFGATPFPDAGTGHRSPSTAKRRSRIPAVLSLLAGLVVLLLGGVLYTLYNPPANEALADATADLDGLKRRVAAVESRPVSNPADLSPLQDRVAALEGAVAALKDEVGSLGGRLDASTKPSAAPDTPGAQAATPPPAIDLAPVQDRLAALDGTVKDLQGKVSSPPPVDLAPVQASVAALTQDVATLKSSVADMPRVDLAPLKAQVADIDHRLAPLESAFAAPKTARQVIEARAAPLAVTGDAVLRAIDAGKPFTTELTALKTLGVDEDKLAPLAPFAATGAPTRAELLSGFDTLRDKLAGSPARSTTGNLLDRFLAGAQGLVKIRPAGVAAGGEPGAVAARIEADLRASDLPAALNAWNALPVDAQAASQAWADRLKARIGADRAAQAIVTDAIAAIGSAP